MSIHQTLATLRSLQSEGADKINEHAKPLEKDPGMWLRVRQGHTIDAELIAILDESEDQSVRVGITEYAADVDRKPKIEVVVAGSTDHVFRIEDDGSLTRTMGDGTDEMHGRQLASQAMQVAETAVDQLKASLQGPEQSLDTDAPSQSL